MRPDLLVGVAAQIVTPDLGCEMAGFDARRGVAEKIHDDLHSRALVFDDGQTLLALISVEVIAVSQAFSNLVCQRIEAATGIPASHVIIAATHTHCGPVTLNHFFNPGQLLDQNYLERLAAGIVGSAEQAFRTRRARRLRTGLVHVNNIAVNRRTGDGRPIDPNAGVLVAEEYDGTPVAIAINYACHPTVLGPNTLEIGADFPLYTIRKLGQQMGLQTEVLFFNGAEGDISTGHKSNLSAVGVIAPFRTFEKAEELGCRLAEAVIAGLPSLMDETGGLNVQTRTVTLPLKTYKPFAEMSKRRERAAAKLWDLEHSTGDGAPSSEQLVSAKQESLFCRMEEYYALLLEHTEGPEPRVLPTKLTAARIGETAFLSFPGEVFVEIGLRIRNRSRFATTMLLGLANDYIGYVPTPKASESGGYEVGASRVGPEAAVILEDAGVELLDTIAS